MGHKYISKEHILLGIIGGDATGLAAKVLQSAGIDLGVSREQASREVDWERWWL